MTTYAIKTWPESFVAVLSGAKAHEICTADRSFAVGDRLRLREWDRKPYAVGFCGRDVGGGTIRNACARMRGHAGDCDPDAFGEYTGREVVVEVTYLSAGGMGGLPVDLCVMSIRRVEGA